MDTQIAIMAIVVNALVIIGGVAVVLMAMYQRGKTREMQHRERLAMIERGLAPGPAQDPAAFEAWEHPRRHPPATSIGVVITAIGLGLMLLIGAAAEAEGAAFGVGGSVMVLGVAFIVLGELQRRSQRVPPTYPPPPYAASPYPPSPPHNVRGPEPPASDPLRR